MELADHALDTGQLLVENKRLKVAVTDGYLHLLEIQLPGKRRMEVEALLNGLNFDKEAHLR